MSIYQDTTEIKKIFEAEIFKPATPEEVAKRPSHWKFFSFEASFYLDPKFYTHASTPKGLVDDLTGSIGGDQLDLYDVETERSEGYEYSNGLDFTTYGKFKVHADRIENDDIDLLTDRVSDTLAGSIESFSGAYPQGLTVTIKGT